MLHASMQTRKALAAVIVAIAAGVLPRIAIAQGAQDAQELEELTTLCRFDRGPRAGVSTPMAGVVGKRCSDRTGSHGVIVRRQLELSEIVVTGARMRVRPKPLPPTAAVESKPAIGTRLFGPPDPLLPEGYGAVGVIAFRGAPSTDVERSRRILICQAYVTVLLDSQVVLEHSPDTPQIVTIWPRDDIKEPLSVKTPQPGTALTSVCGAAVDHYSFFAGDRWLTSLPDGLRPSSTNRGPFLIAWSPPSAQGDPNVPVLILDLSEFAEEGTITEAFAIWKERIEAEPALWSNGWDRTLLKLKLQAKSDNFGGRVIAAFKLLPLIGD